jgi:hypothetical protein
LQLGQISETSDLKPAGKHHALKPQTRCVGRRVMRRAAIAHAPGGRAHSAGVVENVADGEDAEQGCVEKRVVVQDLGAGEGQQQVALLSYHRFPDKT